MRKLLPHNPLFRNTYKFDYDYDANAAEPPEWLKFLSQLWPNDQEAIETLQEMFGYFLTCDTSHQTVAERQGNDCTHSKGNAEW